MQQRTVRDDLVRASAMFIVIGAVALGVYGVLFALKIIPNDNLATVWSLLALFGIFGVGCGVYMYFGVLQDQYYDGNQMKSYLCPHCNSNLPLSMIPSDQQESYTCPKCEQTITGRAT